MDIRAFLRRGLGGVLDPARRSGLEATERFMSWLRFGISASGAATYLVSLSGLRPIDSVFQVLIGVAFLYSIPHIFIGAGRPTRWTRLRVLFNSILDFALATAAISLTGGVDSDFIWLYPLAILGNVLRYGDVAGALTGAASMLALGTIVLWQGASPVRVVPALVSRLGSFWVLYLIVAYLSRHAMRMERVARRGTQIMEAIGRIGVPVNLAGNVSVALEAVCQEIRALFDVDYVFIWLVEGDELAAAAATGEHRAEFLSFRQPVNDQNLLGARVIREARPIFRNNVPRTGDGPDARLARAYSIKAFAGIPLIHGNAAVGAMILADSRDHHRFREEDLAPAMLLGNLAATALYHASMHDQLRTAYTRTLETLGEAIDVRDAYTGGHSQRIATYADQIARELDCPPEMIEQIRTAALLHDIGKIGIPDSILLKPASLTTEEREIMKRHSLIGARLLHTAGFPQEVEVIVRHLHERYDGTGYPAGLKGEAIPLGARIVAVADAFEAMTSKRVYRKAMAHNEAMAELYRGSGTQFDPVVLRTFARVEKVTAEPAPEAEVPAEADPSALVAAAAGEARRRPAD